MGPSPSTSTFTIGAYGIALQNGNGNIYSGTYGDTAVRWNLDSANKELTFPNGAAIHYDQNSSDIELFSYTNPIKITSGQTNHWTFGTDGKLTNPGEVVISTNNTHGGTGYTGLLTLTSTQDGVSNPNKFVRLNVDGNLQIVNSAYSNTIFDLSDTGHLIVSGGLTVLGAVPAHSYGAVGDKVGMVAFDGDYIYYCKQDYSSITTYSVEADETNTSWYLVTTIPWGSLPSYITAGWTLPDQSRTITDIDNYNGKTRFTLDGSITTSSGATYTLSNPGNINIWVRTAWTGTNW
jgi:hypothetical protein